jgi:aspartate kinase
MNGAVVAVGLGQCYTELSVVDHSAAAMDYSGVRRTWIMGDKERIGGIMYVDDLVKVTVRSVSGAVVPVGDILSMLGDEGISVQFIVQAGSDHLIFCVAQEDLESIGSLVTALGAGVEGLQDEDPVGVVSIFGPDFRQRPGIAGKMFTVLLQQGIPIKGISASASTVSCLIDGDQVAEAVEVLNAVFSTP